MGGYVFGVTGEECGCDSMNVSGDTTSVTCSGWTAAGQTCSFEVRTLSLDCGFISKPITRSVALKSKLYLSDNTTCTIAFFTVPSAPEILFVMLSTVNDSVQIRVKFISEVC